jgi:hypothetical protein
MSIRDSVKAAGASVKNFLAGRTPQAQAVELAREIAAAESELERLAGERKRFVVPKLTGDPEAAAMVEQIDRDSEALQRRLIDLREAKAQVDAAVRAAAEARRREEAAARPSRMAASRRRIFEHAQAIDRAGDALAAAMKAALAEIANLAAVSDSAELARWSGTAARQIRNGLTERFDIDPAAPKRAENNLLGLVSGWTGAKAHWTVSQFFAEILDDTVPHFTSEADAEECRERLAQRGTKTAVLELDGGTFMVIPTAAIFAERGEAEAALASNSVYRTAKAVIVARREAIVIVPAGIAEGMPA